MSANQNVNSNNNGINFINPEYFEQITKEAEGFARNERKIKENLDKIMIKILEIFFYEIKIKKWHSTVQQYSESPSEYNESCNKLAEAYFALAKYNVEFHQFFLPNVRLDDIKKKLIRETTNKEIVTKIHRHLYKKRKNSAEPSSSRNSDPREPSSSRNSDPREPSSSRESNPYNKINKNIFSSTSESPKEYTNSGIITPEDLEYIVHKRKIYTLDRNISRYNRVLAFVISNFLKNLDERFRNPPFSFMRGFNDQKYIHIKSFIDSISNVSLISQRLVNDNPIELIQIYKTVIERVFAFQDTLLEKTFFDFNIQMIESLLKDLIQIEKIFYSDTLIIFSTSI
jgi:hypothetical protein